jgi:hypothetical protein
VRTYVDAFEPQIRELLAAYPAMPAKVIARLRAGADGFEGPGAGAAPGLLFGGPGASRTAYDPDEVAQNDFWFPPGQLKPFDHARDLVL